MSKEYDWEELQALIDTGATVMAGMAEDWGWTADEVTQDIIDAKSVAGINGSDWGTPSVSVDNGDVVDCYIEVE